MSSTMPASGVSLGPSTRALRYGTTRSYVLLLRMRLEEGDDLLAPRERIRPLARHRVLRGLWIHGAAGKAVTLRGVPRAGRDRLVRVLERLEDRALRIRP